MTGLNVNMISVAQHTTEEPSRSSLYGYEFFDIVNSPGSGAWMRQATIGSDSGNWIRLANFVGAVVVGAGFGDVIRPSTSGWCKNIDPLACVTVPSGSDYLAMPVHCVIQLLRGVRGKIEDRQAHYIKLADGVYWIVSGLNFQTCCSGPYGQANCWRRRETFQRLESTRLRRTTTTEFNVSLTRFPSKGAVVFGKPMRVRN